MLWGLREGKGATPPRYASPHPHSTVSDCCRLPSNDEVTQPTEALRLQPRQGDTAASKSGRDCLSRALAVRTQEPGAIDTFG